MIHDIDAVLLLIHRAKTELERVLSQALADSIINEDEHGFSEYGKIYRLTSHDRDTICQRALAFREAFKNIASVMPALQVPPARQHCDLFETYQELTLDYEDGDQDSFLINPDGLCAATQSVIPKLESNNEDTLSRIPKYSSVTPSFVKRESTDGSLFDIPTCALTASTPRPIGQGRKALKLRGPQGPRKPPRARRGAGLMCPPEEKMTIDTLPSGLVAIKKEIKQEEGIGLGAICSDESKLVELMTSKDAVGRICELIWSKMTLVRDVYLEAEEVQKAPKGGTALIIYLANQLARCLHQSMLSYFRMMMHEMGFSQEVDAIRSTAPRGRVVTGEYHKIVEASGIAESSLRYHLQMGRKLNILCGKHDGLVAWVPIIYGRKTGYPSRKKVFDMTKAMLEYVTEEVAEVENVQAMCLLGREIRGVVMKGDQPSEIVEKLVMYWKTDGFEDVNMLDILRPWVGLDCGCVRPESEEE